MCTPHSTFDRAVEILKIHRECRRTKESTKKAKESIRRSTSSDEYKPVESHLKIITSHVEAFSWSPDLVKSITSTPLAYTPAPLQSLGSIHNPLGNSIHNSSSVAGMSVALHGVRVFKALIVVHSTLQNRKSETSAVNETAWDEFKFWMETIVHDVKYQIEGERGYGKLAALYATYLKTKLCLSLSDTPRVHQSSSTCQSLYHSTVALRETLLSSIQEHSVNGARCMALRLVLQDCLQMDRKLAVDGEETSEELAMKMGALELDVKLHEEVDSVERCNGQGKNI